jgi:hypothetical protein
VIGRGLFTALIFLLAAVPAALILLLAARPAQAVNTVVGAGSAIDTVTEAASSLVGAPVTVACVDLSEEWWGSAEVGGSHMELDHDVCAVLAASPRLYRGRYMSPSSGASVLTLAHEAAHLRGVIDEREADCFAILNLRQAALGLGYQVGQLPALRTQAVKASLC